MDSKQNVKKAPGRKRLYEGRSSQSLSISKKLYDRKTGRATFHISERCFIEFEECRKSYKFPNKEDFLLELLNYWKEEKNRESFEMENTYEKLESRGSEEHSTSESEEIEGTVEDPTTQEADAEDVCFSTFGQLRSLLNGCSTINCNAKIKEINTQRIGYSCKIIYSCVKKHKSIWYSCPISGGRIAMNSIVPVAVILSGGIESKFGLFSNILRLGSISTQNFYRIQKNYVTPVVNEYLFNEHLPLIRSSLRGRRIIISDGRLDSPGHSAKKCTVTFADYQSKKIVHVENSDASQFENISNRMEPASTKKGLELLISSGFHIKELVTDAHPVVKRFMKDEFPTIFHSFDMWHKSKKITIKLTPIGQRRGCQVLLPWISAIRNHFYYAAQNCNENLEEMKFIWSSLLKHIVNDHTLCKHGNLNNPSENRQWLSFGSEPFLALKNFVTSNFVVDFPYYLRCRSSAELESFHNVILKYASKRIGYRNGYSLRISLAVLDWNNNQGRNIKYLSSRVSKRTKKTIPRKIPVPKSYEYLALLLHRISERLNI